MTRPTPIRPPRPTTFERGPEPLVPVEVIIDGHKQTVAAFAWLGAQKKCLRGQTAETFVEQNVKALAAQMVLKRIVAVGPLEPA